MKAGTLDRRVTIQRKTVTQSPSGDSVEAWEVVSVVRRPASMRPVIASERFASPEKIANEQIEFRVRYAASIASLTPLDRVIHPALTAEQAADESYIIPERSIHDVLGVLEIGRREGLRVITSRRADVTT